MPCTLDAPSTSETIGVLYPCTRKPGGRVYGRRGVVEVTGPDIGEPPPFVAAKGVPADPDVAGANAELLQESRKLGRRDHLTGLVILDPRRGFDESQPPTEFVAGDAIQLRLVENDLNVG